MLLFKQYTVLAVEAMSTIYIVLNIVYSVNSVQVANGIFATRHVKL